jgi:TrmH family RNA methyltransferase
MARPEVLTSAGNPFLKEIKRAAAQGALTADGCAVAEGPRLLGEALRSPVAIQAVVAAESALGRATGRLGAAAGVRLVAVPGGVFKEIACTETPQGVLALVRPPAWTLEQVFGERALVVILDGVQDPGNAGAVVRSAEAFGATGVVFLRGTANPWSPKALRGSAGSLFRVPAVRGVSAAEAVAACAAHGAVLYAAVARGGAAPHEAGLAEPCALAIGGEGRGAGKALIEAARLVTIPARGVESLNAAVAAGVLLYEARRQRGGGARP